MFGTEIFYWEKDSFSVNDTSDWKETNPSTCPPNRRRTYDLLVTSPDSLSPSYRRLVGAKATLLLLDQEQSLFFLGPASKIRETRKWPRSWLDLAALTLARAYTSLTKSEEKERLLVEVVVDYCTREIFIDVGGAYAGSCAATRRC